MPNDDRSLDEYEKQHAAKERKEKRDFLACYIFARSVNADLLANTRIKAQQAKAAADIMLEELGI
jgi:hypothetical protein